MSWYDFQPATKRPATSDESKRSEDPASAEQPQTSNQKMAACPNCQQQVPEISELKFCPFCGGLLAPETVTSPPAGNEPVAPEPAPTATAEPATPVQEYSAPGPTPQSYVPWEDRQRLGFLPAFSQTWSDSVFRPTEFFRRAPKTGNVGAALLYAILIAATGGLLSIFWEYLFWDSFANWQSLENIFGQEISRRILGFWALFIPFIAIISIFIASFIFHLCLMLTGSSRNGFEATLRGYCYSYGPYLFVLVPICGGAIALIWQYVVMVIGWRELHESTTGRVLFAALLPFFVCCGAIIMLVWSVVGLFNRLGP